MPLAQRLWQWQPSSPAAALRGPSTPAGPCSSSLWQESEERGWGRGEPGSPEEQDAGGRWAVLGEHPPATLTPRGRAGGTAQPQNTGLRSHCGKQPHAGGFTAEVPEPRAGRSLPSLAIHRMQRCRCKSPSPAWLRPATASTGAGGRGTPSPCRSVPFGGAVSSGSTGSHCGAGGAGSLPPGRGETSQPAETGTTPASLRGAPRPALPA